MTFALTIGGFDGSSGAGVLADIKAMEFFGVYGQAVCTAATVQNENEFIAPDWLLWERIEAQLEALASVRSFSAVKIGLVEKFAVLKKLVHKIRALFPNAFLLWDPIFSSSSGFRFFKNTSDPSEFFTLFPEIDLITPNQEEFNQLGLGLSASRGELGIGTELSVLLKGGHSFGEESADILFFNGERRRYASPRIPGKGKHGSGCALSAAIVANIALGHTLPEACEKAKHYMDLYQASGEGRLAFVEKK